MELRRCIGNVMVDGESGGGQSTQVDTLTVQPLKSGIGMYLPSVQLTVLARITHDKLPPTAADDIKT